MITALLVAVIGSAGVIAAALINNGRHAKEIRRQITPGDDKTMAELVTEFNRDITAIAVAFGLHDRDTLRHRSAPERNRHVE